MVFSSTVVVTSPTCSTVVVLSYTLVVFSSAVIVTCSTVVVLSYTLVVFCSAVVVLGYTLVVFSSAVIVTSSACSTVVVIRYALVVFNPASSAIVVTSLSAQLWWCSAPPWGSSVSSALL